MTTLKRWVIGAALATAVFASAGGALYAARPSTQPRVANCINNPKEVCPAKTTV